MQFCHKLDFLMNITNTSNSALSRSVNLDASHISRLRSGRRNAPRDRDYLKAMSGYFARRCTEDYQLKALFDTMKLSPAAPGEGGTAEQIFLWLTEGENSGARTVEHFLIGFSNAKAGQAPPAAPLWPAPPALPRAGVGVYYGVEGKRQAVILFLSAVIACKKPQTLLLFSDEATDWMTADRSFAARWASLMSQVLARGNRIRIIHTVSRDLDEMLSAITQWMPLYMSGAIEPYFYPKKRDGVFKKTLFIAPDTMAVASGSAGNMIDKAANLIFRDRRAVAALQEEFDQYLAMCRPLMRIFTFRDEKPYLDTLLEFEKEKSDSIMKTESLSLLTMPEAVVAGMISRLGKPDGRLLEYHRNRTDLFLESLRSSSFTEIVRLPDAETVLGGSVKVAFSVLLDGGAGCYTPEEYIAHLENLVL
ncbi:MAG TPA: transcriptional regulator, partial [Oscillospiraceae bacterium]|nr:transcriptional regulator [Oscillospiraceae bacterium]